MAKGQLRSNREKKKPKAEKNKKKSAPVPSMFGLLVVVLSPDHITDLGFRTGKCHILLIRSLRVLRSRLGTRSIRRPPVG